MFVFLSKEFLFQHYIEVFCSFSNFGSFFYIASFSLQNSNTQFFYGKGLSWFTLFHLWQFDTGGK